MENIQNNYKSLLQYMFTLQNEFNEKLNPKWKEANYDFDAAILVELGELIDSTNWKWWKFQENNFTNARVECIDIWHFLMSKVLVPNSCLDIDEVISNFINGFVSNGKEDVDVANLTKYSKKFMLEVLANSKEFITSFAKIASFLFDSIEEFYNMYLIKNTLNFFRNTNGYKTGSYNKFWNHNGKVLEDNEVALEILKSNPSLTIDGLLDELKKSYELGIQDLFF